MNCYAKRNLSGSAEKAEALLDRMISEGRLGVSPNVFLINGVLAALTMEGAALHAKEL